MLEAAKMSVHPQYLPDDDLDYECRVFHVDLEWMRSYRIATVHRRWEMEEERPQCVLIPIEGACFLDEQTVIRRRIQQLQAMLKTENKKMIPDEALTRLYNTTFSLYRWEKHVTGYQCDTFTLLEVGLARALHQYTSRCRHYGRIFNRIRRFILQGHERRAELANWQDYYRRNGGKYLVKSALLLVNLFQNSV